MRKGLLTMFLLALVGMAGNNVTVMAQTPEPSGQWTFSDPNDLMKASKGNLVLTPAVMGKQPLPKPVLQRLKEGTGAAPFLCLRLQP